MKGEFRGKSTIDGKWEYGYLMYSEQEDKYYIGVTELMTPVDPDTIGRMTGLLDKNGNKIFEGDLVEYPDYSNGACFGFPQPRRITEIEYEEIFNGYGYKQLHFDGDKLEIIGNIHDNPDLV